jgi:hypothetical protein
MSNLISFVHLDKASMRSSNSVLFTYEPTPDYSLPTDGSWMKGMIEAYHLAVITLHPTYLLQPLSNYFLFS